jgi:hypothetical protein
MNHYKAIEQKISSIPPFMINELEAYIDYLLQKVKVPVKKKKLKQNWAGALKEYKKKYSAVELQKKALEWRAEL